MGRSRLIVLLLVALLWALLPIPGEGGEASEAGDTHLLAPIYFYRGYAVGKGRRASGLHVSRDGGRNWECRTWPELITNSVSVDESGRIVYLACGNGVMVSKDGARSWRLTGGWRMTEVQKVAIDRRDPKRAWAATAYGIFLADDAFGAGEVWRKADHDALFRYATDVRQDVVDPDTIWVASTRGLFVSRDGGRSFAATGVDVPVRRILVDPRRPRRIVLASDGRGVLESTDAGADFDSLEGSRTLAFTVTGDPDDPDVLYAGGREDVRTRRGSEWRDSGPDSLPEAYYVYGLVRDPDVPHRLIASGNDGLFESRDGGGDWKRLGFPDALIGDVTAARLADVPVEGPPDTPGTLVVPGRERAFADHRPAADAAFEARRQALLAHFRARPTPAEGKWLGWERALQAVVEGRADEALWSRAQKALEAPSHSMFFSLPLIGFYLHARKQMPEPLAREIGRVLTEVPIYRGDTENHWVMHYAALLLAAQSCPETSAATWYAGRTTQELYDEARGWLMHWARLTATKGQGEFDSPSYLFMYVTPMLLLYEFAEEPAIRQLAGMMLDLLLADFFTESLRGAYCGGHSRVVTSDAERTTESRASVLHYLYAGGATLPEAPPTWALFAALSRYRPPSVLTAIANRRDTPYVHTERKRVRNVIRFHPLLNPLVHKYDYMTEGYGMGSLQGGILQPVQQHTWDVTWTGSAQNSLLFTVHPSVSARELAMFFPEELHGLTRTITAQKGSYASADKLVSASAFEKVFQHENVLLALYQVPPEETFGHVDAYVPDCLAWTEEAGWMFGRDGSFHVALFPCRAGTWKAADGFRRYRCPADRNGFVVVAPRGEVESSFDAFRERVLASPPPRLDGTGKDLTLRWRDADGRAYARAWGEPHGRIDGAPAPFPAEWLYRGPFLESRVDSGRIALTDGATVRMLDFNDLTVSESR